MNKNDFAKGKLIEVMDKELPDMKHLMEKQATQMESFKEKLVGVKPMLSCAICGEVDDSTFIKGENQQSISIGWTCNQCGHSNEARGKVQ